MIAKVVAHNHEKVSLDIDRLAVLACEYQDREVVRLMKKIVPEFKSYNSTYEELDKEPLFVNV